MKNIIPQIWFDLICFISVEANNLKKIWSTNSNPRNLIWFDLIFFDKIKFIWIWFDKGNSTLRFFEYLKGTKDFFGKTKQARSYFPWEAIFREKPFFCEKQFKKKPLPLLPCNEWSKTFSESGSLKTHLTIIHLLVKNVPNNFLGRSHSPVLCSLFHKRKSVVPCKDSKNSNLVSTFSLLHHFWHCLQICL